MNPKPPVFDDINFWPFSEILVIFAITAIMNLKVIPGWNRWGFFFGYSTYIKEHLCQISACYHFWLGFSTHRPDDKYCAYEVRKHRNCRSKNIAKMN